MGGCFLLLSVVAAVLLITGARPTHAQFGGSRLGGRFPIGGMFDSPFGNRPFGRPLLHPRHANRQPLARFSRNSLHDQSKHEEALKQQQIQQAQTQLQLLVDRKAQAESRMQELNTREAQIRDNIRRETGTAADIASRRSELTRWKGPLLWKQKRRLQDEEHYVNRSIQKNQYNLQQLQLYREQLLKEINKLQSSIGAQKTVLQTLTRQTDVLSRSEDQHQQHDQPIPSREKLAQQRQRHHQEHQKHWSQSLNQQYHRGEKSTPHHVTFQKTQDQEPKSQPEIEIDTQSEHLNFIETQHEHPARKDTPEELYDPRTGYLLDEDGLVWQAGGIWVGEDDGDAISNTNTSPKRVSDKGLQDDSHHDVIHEIDNFLLNHQNM